MLPGLARGGYGTRICSMEWLGVVWRQWKKSCIGSGWAGRVRHYCCVCLLLLAAAVNFHGQRQLMHGNEDASRYVKMRRRTDEGGSVLGGHSITPTHRQTRTLAHLVICARSYTLTQYSPSTRPHSSPTLFTHPHTHSHSHSHTINPSATHSSTVQTQ